MKTYILAGLLALTAANVLVTTQAKAEPCDCGPGHGNVHLQRR